MVNKKITDLTDLPTPVAADVIAIVDDVGGAGVATKKATLSNALAAYDAQTSTLENKTINTSSNTLTVAPADVTGTAAILGANTFTGDQNIGGLELVTTSYNLQNFVSVLGLSGIKISPNSGNTVSTLSVLPAGSNTQSGLSVYRSSDLTNYELLYFGSDIVEANAFNLYVTNGGTGTLRPFNINVNGKLISFNIDNTITSYVNLIMSGNDVSGIQNLVHDTSATTVALDFSADQLQTITVAATATFTCATYIAGASKTIKILDSGSGQTLAFPAGWKFVGAKPTAIVASKTGILTLTCFSTTEASVVAAYAEEA